MRSVMLGVGAPGAEPLGPIGRYVRLRLTRPRPCRGARSRRGRAAADDHGALQQTPAQHHRTVAGERDGRGGDDENEAGADAYAHDQLHCDTALELAQVLLGWNLQ
jgi:hypothetical protein